MILRPLVARVALWAAVCALVLRAGMPFLAVAAAQQLDLPLGEMCAVYGVVLPGTSAIATAGPAPRRGGHPHQRTDSDGDHGCEHCALSALGTLGAPSSAPQAVEVRFVASPTQPPVAIGVTVHDACADWAAQLGHGPPSTPDRA